MTKTMGTMTDQINKAALEGRERHHSYIGISSQVNALFDDVQGLRFSICELYALLPNEKWEAVDALDSLADELYDHMYAVLVEEVFS